MHAFVKFPMPETYTEVRAFCGWAGHYHHFIQNFAHLACALYDMLDYEVKMGPVTLSLEVQETVRLLKEKILSTPILMSPDFDKPFLLEN